MDVKINVSVSEERRTATIMEAQTKTPSVKPGENVDIAVKIKPFRGEPIQRVVSFTVPKEQPAGPLTLEVRGGGMVPLIQLLSKQQGLNEGLLMLGKPKQKNQEFADVIKEFMDRDRNNEIVVEVLDMGMNNLLGTDNTSKEKMIIKNQEKKELENTIALKANLKDVSSKNTKKQGIAKNRVTTDYIIDGDAQVIVNVVKDTTK